MSVFFYRPVSTYLFSVFDMIEAADWQRLPCDLGRDILRRIYAARHTAAQRVQCAWRAYKTRVLSWDASASCATCENFESGTSDVHTFVARAPLSVFLLRQHAQLTCGLQLARIKPPKPVVQALYPPRVRPCETRLVEFVRGARNE